MLVSWRLQCFLEPSQHPTPTPETHSRTVAAHRLPSSQRPVSSLYDGKDFPPPLLLFLLFLALLASLTDNPGHVQFTSISLVSTLFPMTLDVLSLLSTINTLFPNHGAAILLVSLLCPCLWAQAFPPSSSCIHHLTTSFKLLWLLSCNKLYTFQLFLP